MSFVLQAKLQERDDALAQRQSQVLELHTELSQLQRLFKMGPAGALRSSTRLVSAPSSPGAAWGVRDSGGVYSPSRAGGQLGSAGSRSAPEDVLAAATDGELTIRVVADAEWAMMLQLSPLLISYGFSSVFSPAPAPAPVDASIPD